MVFRPAKAGTTNDFAVVLSPLGRGVFRLDVRIKGMMPLRGHIVQPKSLRQREIAALLVVQASRLPKNAGFLREKSQARRPHHKTAKSAPTPILTGNARRAVAAASFYRCARPPAASAGRGNRHGKGCPSTFVFRRTDIPVCRHSTGKNACPPDTN